MRLKTKKLREEHGPEVITMINRTFGKQKDGLDDIVGTEYYDRYDPDYRDREYYVLLDGQKIVGVYGLYSATEHPENVTFIGWNIIRPRYRGKGIGTSVLKKMEKIARKNGKEFLYVVAYNPIMDFYLKRGFRKSNSAKLKKFYMSGGCTLLYKRIG